MGFDYDRLSSPYQSFGNTTDIPPLDILDPDYDILRPEYSLLELSQGLTQSYGVYLQDQIAFSDNLKLLIGGRYDWISSEFEIFGDGIDSPYENDGAFSPRIGLVYQPSGTDAAVYYRRGRFRGSVNIRNLFNITYADAAYSTNNVSRGNPFIVVGSVSWEL